MVFKLSQVSQLVCHDWSEKQGGTALYRVLEIYSQVNIIAISSKNRHQG